jgi:OTU domain-containing protein 7
VIPLTDSEHELLPIQFNIDPGEQFVWGRDEHIPNLASRFNLAQKDRMGLLREYLDVIQVPLSPADGDLVELEMDGSSPLEEEEIERRLSEVDLECDEMSSSSDSGVYKSKAAKQLQSVAKQFGSIGKSMSKRIKKNFGSITKMTRNNSLKKKNGGGKRESESRKQSQDHILCAVLHTEKRHEYQEEMVRNYLQSARLRFERDRELKSKQAEERRVREDETDGAPVQCVNPGCSLYGMSTDTELYTK